MQVRRGLLNQLEGSTDHVSASFLPKDCIKEDNTYRYSSNYDRSRGYSQLHNISARKLHKGGMGHKTKDVDLVI